MAFNVYVPSFRKIKEDDDTFTVFTVDVLVNGNHHSIEKRYSEFEELHKMLKKVMKTPEFPPKKVLKWNVKVLEQRRQGLEVYLQGVFEEDPLPHALHLFLGVDLRSFSAEFQDDSEEHTSHQPLLVLDASACLHPTKKGSLPDIVSEGVVLGLYSTPSAVYER